MSCHGGDVKKRKVGSGFGFPLLRRLAINNFMLHFEYTSKDKVYEFRGKTFKMDPLIATQLNYALGANRAPDRYVKIKTTKQKDK
jgi:hypothetical protein